MSDLTPSSPAFVFKDPYFLEFLGLPPGYNEKDLETVDKLQADLADLIATSRQRVAVAVNLELTMLYWTIGHRLHSEVLDGERAKYGASVIDQIGRQLAGEFGRGFDPQNLRRMVKFAVLQEADHRGEAYRQIREELVELDFVWVEEMDNGKVVEFARLPENPVLKLA